MNKDMFRKKPNVVATGKLPPVKGAIGGGFQVAASLEVRPGGMLVQKRNSDPNLLSNHVPTIKVKVKFGSSYHEVNINSQASFGDLKKMLAGSTGLHPQDQKLIYKDKERDSELFLDVIGVKNGSKLVLMEDEFSKEKRHYQSQKNTKMEKASEEVSKIRIEVDKLAKQVASIEMEIHGGKIVMEKSILDLTELLMTQLIKLDAIVADGDVKLQRRMQVTRVQKYIETLDKLKISNSIVSSHGDKVQIEHQRKNFTPYVHQDKPKQRKLGIWTEEKINPRPVVVTTKWETF